MNARSLVVALAISTSSLALAEDHAREFDFWVGEWDVQNVHRQDDGTWKDTWTAKAKISLVCDGEAVLEEWTGTNGNPLMGFSLRAYDETLERWVVMLNWTAGQSSGFGRMEGVAAEDHISIFPPGALESGQQRIERYTFSKAEPESCQWDAARTADGGATWQMYWIMRFTRTGAALELDASNAPIVEVPEGAYCDDDVFRQLDDMIGVWRGTARDGERRGAVSMRGTSMIAGCGVQLFTDIEWEDGTKEQSFEAVSFDRTRDAWFRCALERDDRGRIRTHETAVDAEAGTWSVPRRDEGHRDVWTISRDAMRRERQRRDGVSEWRADGVVLDVRRAEVSER